MPSEHQAKATLQTRIEKGKAFKNGPWLPEQSHWVTDGRSGTPSGEPAVQSAARCTGCRGGWRLRRRDSNPLFAGRLRPPRPPSPGLREAPVEPSDPRPPASPRTGLPPPSSSQVSLPSHPGASRPVPVPAQQRASLASRGHRVLNPVSLAVPITFPKQMWHVMGRVRDNVTFCTV